MPAETKEFRFPRFPIYDQAKQLVRKPHFGCSEGITPSIFMPLRQRLAIISGKIVLLVDHNIPYDQYVAVQVVAEKPVIPSYSTELRIYRNDTVKDVEGQLLDAKRIKRLSSFLSGLGKRIKKYDTYMLKHGFSPAKTVCTYF